MLAREDINGNGLEPGCMTQPKMASNLHESQDRVMLTYSSKSTGVTCMEILVAHEA